MPFPPFKYFRLRAKSHKTRISKGMADETRHIALYQAFEHNSTKYEHLPALKGQYYDKNYA